MKKITLSILSFAFASASIAQDGGGKVDAGLNYQLGLGFNKPSTKTMDANGIGLSNSIGLTLNFNFSDKLGLSTGVEFDFESMNFKTTDSTYYAYNDTDILRKKDDKPSTTNLYMLEERKYKTTFVTIPTMLIFKMKPLGAFTPYGKFGARTSFLVKSKIFDQGKALTASGTFTDQSNTEMSAKSDMFILRSSVGIGGGTQWEFSGGTSVFAEVCFFYGFTPLFNPLSNVDNMHLYSTNGNNSGSGNDLYFRNKATQKHLALKIGILF